MKYFYNFLIGILMGFGAILPGVSSGVFCVIFGIYEKLVNSIINFFKDFKTNFLFLFPIGLGGIVGVVLFGNVIKYFFSLYKFQSCYAFIGLILGTIPSLFKQASTNKYVEIKNIAGGNHQSLAVLVSPCTPFQGTLENRGGAYVMPLRGDDMVFGVSY